VGLGSLSICLGECAISSRWWKVNGAFPATVVGIESSAAKTALISHEEGTVTINLIVSMCFTHELLLCFTLVHISNGSVSASLVGHVLYSENLMSATCIPHLLLMVHGYIYSRYSSVFLMLLWEG